MSVKITKHVLVCGAVMLLAACSHSSSGSFTNGEIRAAVAKQMGSAPPDLACKPDDAEMAVIQKAKAKSGDESKNLGEAVLDCTHTERGMPFPETTRLLASRNEKDVVYAIPFTDEMAAHIQKVASEPPQPPLPQPDMSTPDSAYVAMSDQDGEKLTFLYAALSSQPIDYDKIAQQTSPQYAETGDAFQRRDMLNALRPKIDAAIADAKEHRYYTYSVSNGFLDNYDLRTKTFPAGMYSWQSGPVTGMGAPVVKLTNAHTPGNLGPDGYPVSDEAEARAIQALIDKRSAIGVKVFFFAQADAKDTSDHVIRSVVTRYQLIAPDGKVLHTQVVYNK